MLDKHAPVKKYIRKEQKLALKPWVTNGINTLKYQKYFEKNNKSSRAIWQGIHDNVYSRKSKKNNIYY